MRAIERAVARRLARATDMLASRARETVPSDVRVEIEDGAVVLVGQRLRARSLTDARLRGIGR